MSLKSIFKNIVDFLSGPEPTTEISKENLAAIQKHMKACRSDLEIGHEPYSMLSKTVRNIGLVVPENTNIISLWHAEGNLQKAFEEATGTPLPKEKIIKYTPAQMLAYDYIHFPM